MKAPEMLYGERLSEHKVGKYTGILWHRIESGSATKYEFIMAVHDSETDMACMFIASEINEEAAHDSGETYYLGVFYEDEYERIEPSSDWADADKFKNRALQIVMEKFDVDVMELVAPGEMTPKVTE